MAEGLGRDGGWGAVKRSALRRSSRPAPRTPLRRRARLTATSGLPRKATSRTPSAAAPRKAPRDTGFPAKVKLLIRTRAGNGNPENACCEACAMWLGEDGGQIQHIYARGKGGTRNPLYSTTANGCLLCGTRYTGCHYLCEDRAHPLNAHMNAMGFWRLRNGREKPGDYPIMLHGQQGGTTVWLDTAGGYAATAPGEAA